MSAGDQPRLSTAEIIRLREIAERAARVGGRLAREAFGTALDVRFKSDRSEVTEIDLEAERAIVASIRSDRPDDGFIGEEATANTAGDESPSGRVVWVIDPIDGTRNFVCGIPLFVCSVAAMAAGRSVAAAIYDPLRDVMYSAAKAQGTTVDGVTASVTEPDETGRKLIVAVPSVRRPSARKITQVALDHEVIRNLGTTAMHMALVAGGAVDAAISNNSKLWDIAAGSLLVTEAGGVVSSPFDKPIFPVDLAAYAGEDIPTLAGAAHAHRRLVQDD